MEIQTRSDSPGKFRGLHLFSTVKEAYEAYCMDNNIWKISWEENGQSHRFRPKTKSQKWNHHSENKLCQLSQEYKEANENDFFWIDQPMTIICRKFMENTAAYSDEELENIILSESIKEVLTKEEFIKKYCS